MLNLFFRLLHRRSIPIILGLPDLQHFFQLQGLQGGDVAVELVLDGGGAADEGYRALIHIGLQIDHVHAQRALPSAGQIRVPVAAPSYPSVRGSPDRRL